MKTIFITLPSPLEYRNLFGFPECVFDVLRNEASKNPSLRIVVLVNKKDFEKYRADLGNVWNDRIIMEPLLLNYKRNLAQRFYLFFSSYLLYTKTTEILATMGMRPGEPPAGGKRWLNPIKQLLANTLGRSRFVREHIATALYRFAYPSRPFKEIFEKYSPSVVLVSSLYNRFDRHIMPESKLQNVPTLGISAGWDHIDKYYLPFHATRFLSASEQMCRAAINFQNYRPEQITIVGYPQYDFLLDKKYASPREDVISDIGFPSGARYIMYVSGSAYCPDEPDIITEILKWIDSGAYGNNTYLVVRPYLGSRGKDKEFDEEKFLRFKNHPKVFFYDMKRQTPLEELKRFVNILRQAHVVMAVYSTALLETAILGRPIVAAPFDGYAKRPFYRSIKRFRGFEHFQDVIRFGALKEAFNFPQLKNILGEYLENPAKDAEKRARMCEDLCYKLDGKASERIVGALLEYVN
jgi:hypothetical protein